MKIMDGVYILDFGDSVPWKETDSCYYIEEEITGKRICIPKGTSPLTREECTELLRSGYKEDYRRD